MEKLQKIIDERAKRRATDEIQAFIEKIKENTSILDLLGDEYIIIKDDPHNEEKRKDIRSAFWQIDKILPQRLIEKLTQIYIPIESKKFVDDVERLKGEVEELFFENEQLRH